MTAFSISAVSMSTITVGFAIVILITLVLAWRLTRRDPRQQAVSRLLDAADALESRLRTARAEIETATGVEDESVRTALQEMLRQRLWLQQHGAQATLRQLNEMRASIEQARARIDQQLALIERARTSEAR